MSRDFKYTENEKLNFRLNNLPSNPGVYMYFDKKGNIIYIGKAKVLKNRIRSYFLNVGKHQQFKTEVLVRKIHNLEYIITDNELEALVLEANLIKKHKPKYNIDLKDDKSYPYLAVTKELYPRLYITRSINKENTKYYGPYTNVKAMRELLSSLKKIAGIRNCDLNLTENSIKSGNYKLCLDYHIKICSGPCKGLDDPELYRKRVKEVISFLTGNDKELMNSLKKKMIEASDQLNFELAALCRDQIKTLENYLEKQKVESADQTATDYVAVACEDNDACCVVFKVRNGRMIARNHYFLDGVYQKNISEILEEFVSLYYQKTSDYPELLLSSTEVEEPETIVEWLSKLKGKKVYLKTPQIGEKNRMIFLAVKNAEQLLNDMKLEKLKKDYTPRSILSLKRDLNLEKAPEIIECFDISHFAGRQTVASMVCFKNAKPFKAGYRKFNIKTVEGIDDFASMEEVVRRRYVKLETEESLHTPDLVIIDGGKGQLSRAKKVFDELKLDIPVIGLAKRLEEVFFPGDSEPVMLPRTSSSLKLIQQLRDEAHRFAITFHRSKREKAQIHSILDEINGIGEKKRETLIKEFGSIEIIKNLTVEELTKIKGINESLATIILEKLKK
ncbi:MAG: excinuclease ABC subunit C [Candidatus Delongbacteria bacterium]|nr:excinuclease ABC subunit C [Candidatus Delongbacteria bacterium]MBN2836224.1 excinuclease ABC subunit C [Candidatus Delongbacteria bacterium]